MANILVVDDEMGIRALLQEILTDEGHSVELAENAAQARALRERQRPDLVLLDIWMPDVDGITLLKEWGACAHLNMPVIMMSGHGTIDTAVEATKYGAMAFLEKPITLRKLLRAVEQGLAKPAPRPPVPAPAAPLSTLRPEREPGLPELNVGLPHNGVHHNGIHPYPMHAASAQVTAPTLAMVTGPVSEQSFSLDRPLREARDAFEKAYFEFHLARENGSMTRVAERTGLERTHLYRKLKQLGVDLSRNKRGGN
ncbi:response regulator [Sphaerotilus microaerophilus]|uniref:Two-component system response regulator n=1 Tax=Sphaerotilus microaerophilus TaxID=2914710 RepID=A0ABN6PU12_9BURK|nr:response regulator [Sphaerotilus sp. FB-5]BDI08138.1 two-component system response regulator [Sphaerotilus sp. FB-5]